MSTLISGSLPRSLRRERAEEVRTPERTWAHWAWLPVASSIILSVMGVLAIATTEPLLAKRQAVFAVVGLLTAAAVGAQHVRWLQRAAWPLFIVNVFLLVFLLVPYIPEWLVRPRNGARRWINLGFTDFQPSEVMKLAYILSMAVWLRSAPQIRRMWGVVATLLVTAIPVVLIMRQPDLDTALLFIPTLLAMLLAAGARVRHIVILVMLGLVLAPASYPFLKAHQKARVDALIAQLSGSSRWKDTIGYQADRAQTLAGAGGVFGMGSQEATPLIRYNRLPEASNDMIFSVISCRWGLLGGVLVWVAGLAYAVGCFMVALRAGSGFGRLVAVGIGSMFFAQLALNTGMTIGVLPVSGMTLPFVSAGGSSLVSLWVGTGVLFSIASRRTRGFDLAHS